MKPGIECIVKSFNEPQLDRVLEAVNNQTVPFAKVTHICGVAPEVKAHNTALRALEHDWSLWVDGDVILKKNAHEMAMQYVEKLPDSTEILFGLHDWFLNRTICCCPVRRSEFVMRFEYKDVLANDTECARRMDTSGRKAVKLFRDGIEIGSHFDRPDEFQVFRRFYGRGSKTYKRVAIKEKHKKELLIRYKETGNHLFLLASKALEFGVQKANYRKSKDYMFELSMFEVFKKEIGWNG